MQEYQTNSNEELYILNYKPEYLILLIPEYLKCTENKMMKHYEGINEKHSLNIKKPLYSIDTIFLENEKYLNYEMIKLSFDLKSGEKYQVKNIYNVEEKLEFIVESIEVENFDLLSIHHKFLGFKDKSDLIQSLKQISNEKSYKKFYPDIDDVFLLKLKWL